MRLIISPAKKMRVDTDSLPWRDLPAFLPRTERLLSALRSMDAAGLKKLWKCSDQLAGLNLRRLETMDLRRGLTPALLSYEGIQYQHMAPGVFTGREYDYVQEHLRILSGFYGLLRPFDGVTPYRLEMQARAKIGGKKDLYEYWGGHLYREVLDESRILINLASKEYSRCVEKYLQPEDVYITCVFGEFSGEKIVQKGVYAKMARGEMVRYMAENRIQDPEEMKRFDRLGYTYRAELSDERTFIFIKG